MADIITIEECVTRLDAIRHDIVSNSRDHFALSAGIAALYEMEKNAPAVNRWIPCSERLPEPLQNVIVCTDIKTVTLAWLMGDNWYFADTGNGHIEQWGMSDVTHWMPLPEPPEVNSDAD